MVNRTPFFESVAVLFYFAPEAIHTNLIVLLSTLDPIW
jgi:hypothetical protein